MNQSLSGGGPDRSRALQLHEDPDADLDEAIAGLGDRNTALDGLMGEFEAKAQDELGGILDIRDPE